MGIFRRLKFNRSNRFRFKLGLVSRIKTYAMCLVFATLALNACKVDKPKPKEQTTMTLKVGESVYTEDGHYKITYVSDETMHHSGRSGVVQFDVARVDIQNMLFPLAFPSPSYLEPIGDGQAFKFRNPRTGEDYLVLRSENAGSLIVICNTGLKRTGGHFIEMDILK